MKKIDLNFEIIDLEGNKIDNAGQIVGKMLVAQSKGDALKFYDWAISFSKGQTVCVDKSDFKKIYDFIEQSENLFIIAKAPIMNYLNSLKEDA